MPRAPYRPAAWYRVLISLWGVWFATVLMEPAGLMACPQHSAHGAAHASPAEPTHASTHAQSAHAHGAHAPLVDAEGASPKVALVAGESAPTDGGHDCCTCLGQCCTAAPTASVDATPTFAVGALRAVARLAMVHVAVHAERRAYALPFANGPPTRV